MSLVVVTGATVVGLLFRLGMMGQSFFGDELFTYQISTQPGLSDVLEHVKSGLEVSPPLFFVLAWVAQHVGDPFVWLRMVSLATGVATIPLVYVLGKRTVGRPAALVATVLFALSPMGIFYASEARAYALLVFLLVCSTLALLKALDTRNWRWWSLVTVLYAAAMLTHYTSIFVLAAQGCWALWTHRAQWRALVISLGASALLFLPWLPSLVGDSNSQNRKIIELLQPFGLKTAVQQLTRLVAGGPFAPFGTQPGLLGLALVAGAIVLGVVGLAVRSWRTRQFEVSPRAWLIVVLALAAPVGAAAYSLVSDDLFIARDLMTSLVPIYLVIGVLLVTLPQRLAALSLTLAMAGMSLGALTTLDVDTKRPNYTAAADAVNTNLRPTDQLVELNWLTGPPSTMLAVHLDPGIRRTVARTAGELSAAVTEPRPNRILLVFAVYHDQPDSGGQESVAPAIPGFRPVATEAWPGLWKIYLTTYQRAA